MTPKVKRSKPKPPPEPEPIDIVRTEVCKVRGRRLERGMEVTVSKGKVDKASFTAVFMYAYVFADDPEGEPYEVTVYGGSGYEAGRPVKEQGESSFRTFAPHRITVDR